MTDFLDPGLELPTLQVLSNRAADNMDFTASSLNSTQPQAIPSPPPTEEELAAELVLIEEYGRMAEEDPVYTRPDHPDETQEEREQSRHVESFHSTAPTGDQRTTQQQCVDSLRGPLRVVNFTEEEHIADRLRRKANASRGRGLTKAELMRAAALFSAGQSLKRGQSPSPPATERQLAGNGLLGPMGSRLRLPEDPPSSRASDNPGRFPQGTHEIDLAFTNLALGQDINGNSEMSINTNGAFPTFLGYPASLSQNNPLGPSAMQQQQQQQQQQQPQQQQQQRQAPSPQQANNGTANGVGPAMNGMGVGMPVNAGQQMDINLVFQKVLELSEVLKENRERTAAIVASTEELASRAAASGAGPDLQEANHEISAARIAELTRQNHDLQGIRQVLLREQHENTKLIGEYETAMGNIVEQIRNFSYAKDMEKTSSARDYNKLLQDEKDAHLATRLEKDDWHAKYMRCVEMLKTAYKLRCEEEELPIRIVAGLQNEVRGYRSALGIEPEKFEEEFGYEILKDVKNGAGEP